MMLDQEGVLVHSNKAEMVLCFQARTCRQQYETPKLYGKLVMGDLSSATAISICSI